MSSGRSSVRKPQPQLHLRCFDLGHEGFAAPTGRIILLLDAAEVCETLRLRPPHFLAPLDEQPRNVFLNALNHGPVSYTHLDVYKRQLSGDITVLLNRIQSRRRTGRREAIAPY